MKKKIWKIVKDLEKEKINTNEAYHLLCDLYDVVKQSEQLKICDCDEPKPDIMTDSYCLTCLGSTN